MTGRERTLNEKGYRYDRGCYSSESAKAHAKKMRELGYRATVLTEMRNGIPDYSVWTKKEV